MKHTPGPWRITHDKEGGFTYYFLENKKGSEKEEEAEANAKLIAAAPDLLEALEGMIKYFTPFSERERASQIVHKALAAIKKATTLKTFTTHEALAYINEELRTHHSPLSMEEAIEEFDVHEDMCCELLDRRIWKFLNPDYAH